MKRKLKTTDTMYLESSERHWRLLIDGHIQQLETSALITRSKFSTVRIYLSIAQIFPPEKQRKKVNCFTLSDETVMTFSGLNRISEFVYNFFEKQKWILIGHIKDEPFKPIIIAHYPSINLTVYTTKLTVSSPQLNQQNFDGLRLSISEN